MRREMIVIAVIVCFIILGIASAPMALAADKVIFFGSMQPLSGGSAHGGMVANIGLETAVQDLNSAGGIKIGGKHYTFTTKCYDHHYTSEGGATAVNKLVFSDKAKYIIGPIGSAPTLAAQAITEPNKVLFLTTGWHKDVVSPKKPLSCREFPDPNMFSNAMVRWLAKNRPEVKKVAILATNDATGYQSADSAEVYYKELGIEVFKKDFFERESSDFYPYIARYINGKVDAIDLAEAGPKGEGLVCKQARELRFKGLIIGSGMVPESIVKIAGEATEGMLLRQGKPFGTKFATPAEDEWNLRCRKQYNLDHDMSFLALAAYDATWMLAKAIELAGTADDTIKVAEVLENLKFKLPLAGVEVSYQGEKTYGIKRQLTRPIYISQYQKGEWKIIGRQVPSIP